MTAWSDREFIFIGGLHRSGTTLFHDIVASHPAVASLVDTGVPMNEGQFLQDVFAPEGRYRKLWPIRVLRHVGLQRLAERGYGGPGRFAFDAGGHLTEESALVSAINAERIAQSWAPYWDDPMARFLAEKSPPNLIRFRFLQALFPRSRFLLVHRHPVAVSFATQRNWRRRTSLFSLFRHWVHAHRICRADALHLDRYMEVGYEALVADPDPVMRTVYSFLDLDPDGGSIDRTLDPRVNDRYLAQWEEFGREGIGRAYKDFLRRTFESDFSEFGYTLLR